jgi:HK97 family phage major capsid protein
MKTLSDRDTVKLGLVTRSLEIRAEDVDEEQRTVELTFSSEDPYERWFGIEILSHKEDAVDLGFMASGKAPLLAQHNHDDQIGVIEKAWLQEGVGHARVRFGRSGRASEFLDDVRDGIRRNVSVGYYVQEMKLQEEREDGPDVYLATRWKPVEASIVAVPADETVGIRSAEDEVETTILRTRKKESSKMEQKDTPVAEAPKPEPKVDVKTIRDAERKRQADILAIGRMADMEDEAQRAIDTDETVDQFRGRAFDKMVEEQAKPAADVATLSEGEKRDLRSFSFIKAIREAGRDRLTGLEAEMDQEARNQFRAGGIEASGTLCVPYHAVAIRDLDVTNDQYGGYTVDTSLLASSFIDLLRNAMKTQSLGATVLEGLVGDVTIPTGATGTTVAWEGENDAGSESTPTFGQVSLSPERVGTYVEVSKQLLVQSSISVEAYVRRLLAEDIALGIDYAALHGSGSNDQPTGLTGQGIGSVAGGTNGLAPTWAHIVELETDVSVANADVGNLAYLTNAKVRGKLKQIFTNATYGEIPLWTTEGGMGMLNGYRAEVSNQVSSTLTKGSSSGVCSAIFFGNWRELIIALWGGLDLVVDPYSLATTNLTRITANTYADVGVKHAGSFSAMLDALTA